jgi:hypothetical protein
VRAGGPHDSRPGGRRYLYADKLLDGMGFMLIPFLLSAAPNQIRRVLL